MKKPMKYVLLTVGALCLVAPFLPYVSRGGESASMWHYASLASKAGRSSWPVYGILGMAAGLLALSAYALKQKAFNRMLALGALGASLGLTVLLVMLMREWGAPPEGMVKAGGAGFFIVGLGPLVGLLASLVLVISPERTG